MAGLIQDLTSGAGWGQTISDLGSNLSRSPGDSSTTNKSAYTSIINPLAKRMKRRTQATPSTPVASNNAASIDPNASEDNYGY